MRTLIPALSMALLVAFGRAWAAAPSGDVVAKAFPAGDGLAVQLGAADAAFLAQLTNGGKRLVHGLALDDAIRDKVRTGLIAAGVHPLADVATWHGAPRLPYADRLVNLLIVDADDLGGRTPSDAECRRVVAPGGAVLVCKKGAWTATPVERPKTWGDWTHFDGGPDGNAVSGDGEATAIRGLQWLDNVREVRWQKTGPHGGDGGNMRIWDRFAVIDMRIHPEDKDPKFEPRIFLECRDVNNGLPIWRKPRTWGVAARRWSLSVGDGQCFTWLDDKGQLTAIELATGKELRTYPGGEIKPWFKRPHPNEEGPATEGPKYGIFGDSHWVRCVGDTVVANGDGKLRAWTVDGKPLWTFGEDGQRAEAPVVDEKRSTVYMLMVEDRVINKWGRGPMMWQRWPTSGAVKAIVAVDLTTGKRKWANTDVASRDTGVMLSQAKEPLRSAFGQLLVAGDYVVAYNTKAISGGGATLIASLEAETGKTVQNDPKAFVYTSPHGRVEMRDFLYHVLYRDGLVYAMGGFSIFSFNPKSGATQQELGVSWNARCHKPIATRDHFLLGQTAFIGKDFSGEMWAMARSGCAHSPVPGAGLILFGPHLCACVTHLDGYLATTSRPAPPPLPEGERLVKCTGTATVVPAAAKLPASPIAQGWPWFTIAQAVAPVTVEKNGWTFRVDPQAHRLDASRDGTRWSYVADARLGVEFAVVGERVVLGSHDGWVHGLDLKTGAPRWRYVAAPAHRLIVVNGMLTSAWPVFGIADLGNGTVVASAGTHAEMDGGIRIVALEADSGTPVWVKTVTKTSSKIPPGGKGAQIVDRSLINAAPAVENGKIVIAGGAHLGRLEFDPAEPEAEISKRLSTPPPKKR